MAAPGTAHAYTISDALSPGCHEAIASEALRTVRTEFSTAAPLSATDDERALIDDLEFQTDGDMSDLGGVSMLLGDRDNDLKGSGANDLTQLAEVHGNPNTQQEHCLRGPDQKEPGGSAAAVASCRAFIRGRVSDALAGLDVSGKPDPNKRTTLGVHLDLRGDVDAPLPTFYVRIGQALHAVQDSFAHSYRTSDQMKITVSLDWLDLANGTWVESRDGPGHAIELDRCDDPDALRTTRHRIAIEASTAVLRATLDPQKTPDQKLAAIDAILDQYVSYSPGCTYDNGWCNAPERQYQNPSGCACSAGKGIAGTWPASSGLALVFLAVMRRWRSRRLGAAGAKAMLAAAILLATGTARAQAEPARPADPEEAAMKTPAPPPDTKTTAPSTSAGAPWGGFLGGSISVDNPAIAGTLGLRFRASSHWIFGLDGEWNPWVAKNGSLLHSGTANLYGTAIFQIPLAYADISLRSSLSFGASELLFNLYGAPKGSTGLYADVSFLGVAWKVSRAFLLIINPVNWAIPAPQLKGVPLTYPQYRFTMGLEAYFG